MPDPGTLRYRVQKYAARRLHDDPGLEFGVILESQAVTRGLSLVVGERHLAVEAEDNGLDYADLERITGPGHYHAGIVLLWNRGGGASEGDAAAAFAAGLFTFTLHGERLTEQWRFMRVKLRPGERLSHGIPLGRSRNRRTQGLVGRKNRTFWMSNGVRS